MRILENARASLDAGEQSRALTLTLSRAKEFYRRAVITALEDSSGT
jgi:hypothetical protein